MSEQLHDSVALVTGASAGIGAATARALAAAGADVSLAARRTKRLEELAAELTADNDVRAHVVPTDVTDEGAVRTLVEDTVTELGGLDTVVSNAGVGGPGRIEEITSEDFHRLMEVNVNGMFYLTHAALPHLKEAAGHLIFVSSFAGQYPRPGASVYAASKWWTRGFALSLAGTVGPDDVAVTVVNPTEVRTEIGGGDSPPMNERYDPGEVTEPEAIADAIVFAASQDSPDTANEIDLYRRDKFAHF